MQKIKITPEIIEAVRNEVNAALSERGETLNDLRGKKAATGWPVSFYSLYKLMKYPKEAESGKLKTTILTLLFVFGYHYKDGIFRKYEQ
jgi:hypothetical protein